MKQETMNATQKLTFSAMIMALYVVILYLTQSFSFGAYQIRIATSLYALSYPFPFLVFPLGLANFISNTLFGGLGPLDMFGGFLVGVLTCSCNVLIRRMHWNRFLIIPSITLIPGLGAAVWLSYLLQIPYPAMALSLCIGQFIPALCGVPLISLVTRIFPYSPFSAGGNA